MIIASKKPPMRIRWPLLERLPSEPDAVADRQCVHGAPPYETSWRNTQVIKSAPRLSRRAVRTLRQAYIEVRNKGSAAGTRASRGVSARICRKRRGSSNRRPRGSIGSEVICRHLPVCVSCPGWGQYGGRRGEFSGNPPLVCTPTGAGMARLRRFRKGRGRLDGFRGRSSTGRPGRGWRGQPHCNCTRDAVYP